MSSRTLSIIVSGLGTSPQHRSHWAFGIHEPRKGVETVGDILQVQVIDSERLIYQFEERRFEFIRNKMSEGSFPLAEQTLGQSRHAAKIIREEPAPNDGVERCQDWILRAVISLEAEELVPAGTAQRISALVGQSASVVARSVGDLWEPTEEKV